MCCAMFVIPIWDEPHSLCYLSVSLKLVSFCGTCAGEAHSLKVEEVLFQGKSDYQNVLVFQVWWTVFSMSLFDIQVFVFSFLNVDDSVVCVYASVLNLWQGTCPGWCDPTDGEGWMCLSRNDCSSPTFFNSKPEKGIHLWSSTKKAFDDFSS